MNRTNLKIAAAGFWVVASIIWSAGWIKYSKPGPEEWDCQKQQIEMSNADRSNAAPTRELSLRAASAVLTNPASGYEERRLAIQLQRSALESQQSEINAEQVLTDRMRKLGALRHQARSPYNHAAEIMAVIAGGLALILFITKSPKQQSAPP